VSLLRREPAPSTELVVRDRRAAHQVEQRDPRGATQRVGWSSPTLPQVNEWDANQAERLGYLANVIAFRAVQIRANTIASIPIVAGRRLGDATSINPDSPLTRFFGPPPGGPAPRLSARKLIRWTVAREIISGVRAWEIETVDGSEDGRPVAFWPLASAHLRALPSDKGTEWFRAFHYGSYHDPVKFKPGNVFYGWVPSGTDFRQPESALQAARFDLSLVTLSDRYGMAFLQNNAVPATVVTTAAFEDDRMRAAFRQQWAAEFQGVRNAGRTHFHEVDDGGEGPVAEAIDVKVLGISQKDARLVEQRHEAMSEVAIALGVPWSKFDASGRTFDNAEVEDRTFYEETILPQLLDLQDDINMQIAPRLGDEVVWFDLRGVRALQRRMFTITGTDVPALLDRRVILPNEVRTEVGLDAIDGLDDEPEAPDAPELPAAPEPDPDPTDDERTPPVPAARSALMAGLTEPGSQAAAEGQRTPSAAVDLEALEQRRARIWRTTDAAVTAIEARWVRVMRRLFARQEQATIDRLTGKRGRQALTRAAEQRDPMPNIDPSAVFDQEFWVAQTREAAADLFEETATNALNRLTMELDIAFDIEAPYVREFIDERAQQLAGNVTQTTYDAIREAMRDGVQAGESVDDIATRIRGVFTQASQQRAITIARTEVISAYSGATRLGGEQLPDDVVAGYEWISTRDGRTRSSHAEVDGQVIPRTGAFQVGGEVMAYPGDPAGGARNTVNCRCTVALLTPEDFAELSALQPRSRPQIEARTAKALLALVTHDPEFDLAAWTRAAQEVAA
jgi:SPP1 gp7 family putative phage head morphogenesis protein